MKLTDLRIGNYIQTPNGTDRVRGVLNRNCFKDVFLVENSDIEIEEANPIPLTEEWLLRLGFEKKKGLIWENKQHYLFTNETWYIRMKPNGRVTINYRNDFINHLKYVNELQNFFYCLTGDELKK